MNIENENQNVREGIVLGVYSLYTLILTAEVLLFKWQLWIIPVIITGMVICLMMYFKKYKTFYVRALLTSLMTWLNFAIYLMNNEDFTGSFSTLIAMVVLLAMYTIPEFVYIGVVVYTLLLVCHFLLVGDLTVGFEQEELQTLIRIVSVYMTQYVTYCMIKTQMESDEKMRSNMEAVQSAEQSKDDFMANMSHEIRTPINTVCGISEMVLREDLSDKVREEIYDIQTAGKQLLSLVSDILDFTELSSGKMEIVPDTYNITSTINDILNMASAKIGSKNIELIVDCDSTIPRGLVGDEQKICRAVMNVVDNAVKFTEEGGVLISFSAREEEYGVNLMVKVQDTGIGLKEEDLEALFSSFSQVDASRNRLSNGMGLGFSIAKVIVNRMGGFITVKSVYGQGTEVQMVFPQKVSDKEPVTVVEEPDSTRVMLYLDVEKYQNALVREGYTKCIRHMVEKLGVAYRHCSTLAEVKRRLARNEYTHLFVSWKEYCEDREYFERLSEQMNVVLVLDRDHKESIMGSKLLCVYKPFYVMTITAVLNGQYTEYVGRAKGRGSRFIAPSASVLVVDDNLMNLKVAEGLLRPYQIRVSVAESGSAALKKMENERFDLVFMDHMMPEMDGVETFHRIRKKPGIYYQNVPVVALTANAIGGAREMFLQEGFADYVSKPIELSALERVLYKLLPADKISKDYAREEAGGGKAFKPAGTVGEMPARADLQAKSSEKPSGKPEPKRESVSAPGWESRGESESASESKSESKLKLRPEKTGREKPEETAENWLLPGIDIHLGIQYCGGELSNYLDIIRIYHKIGVAKREEIRAAYESKDLRTYVTLVHALKSTSLNIGAVRLSEMAKELEKAGKEENQEYLAAHTGEALEEYGRVLAVIGTDQRIFPSEEGGPKEIRQENDALQEIEPDVLKQKLQQLSAQMESLDSEAVTDGMEALYAFWYRGQSLRELLRGIEERINSFDFDRAQEELTRLQEELGLSEE